MYVSLCNKDEKYLQAMENNLKKKRNWMSIWQWVNIHAFECVSAFIYTVTFFIKHRYIAKIIDLFTQFTYNIESA